MRNLMMTLIAIGVVSAAGPARAQTYDPNYPVCMQVFAPMMFYDCSFTSLPQCAATASGRAALCRANPYYANALVAPSARRHRQRRVD
jgi:Protein of unknown function (DUF3551)